MRSCTAFFSFFRIWFVALAMGLLLAPPPCRAADTDALTVGALIRSAGGVPLVLYLLIAIFILLMAVNAANLVLAWQLVPCLNDDAANRRLDPGRLRDLPLAKVGIFDRSLRAGLQTDGGHHRQLDHAGVLATFQALTRKLFLSPRALKAFGIVVLVVTLMLVGIDLVRLYVELYERMAVVVGNYPFRKLFQAGCARVMVQAMGGLGLFAASVVCGFLFSGAVRVALVRQTDRLAALLSTRR